MSVITEQQWGELLVHRAGDGARPVVLVHGWSCRAEDWQGLLASPPAGVTLYAVALPGHGRARDQQAPAWTIAGLGQALLAGLDAAGLSSPVLVGHSMGGAVVMEAARQRADVAAVILVDTFVIPYGDLSEAQAADIEAPFREDFAAAMANLVTNSVGSQLDEAGRETLIRQMSEGNQAVLLPLWHDLLRWNPEPAFADIRCPIHAINGDLIPEPAKARCQGRLQEWLIPGAGHFPQLEMPEEFGRVFGEVIKQSNQ